MKRQIKAYTFSPGAAGAGTITFSNFATIRLDQILAVFNITRGVLLFSPTGPGGTVSGNQLTLATSTSGHSSGDALHIVYDDADEDYDSSGAGIAYRPAMGLLVPASGGPVPVTGDAAGLNVHPLPSTSGGLSPFSRISTADTNLANVKNAPGMLFGWLATNTNAAVRYLKIYDLAGTPTLSSDVPKIRVLLPGGVSGAGVAMEIGPGIAFANGIAIAIVTGVANTNAGAVAADEIIANLFYK